MINVILHTMMVVLKLKILFHKEVYAHLQLRVYLIAMVINYVSIAEINLYLILVLIRLKNIVPKMIT